MKKRGTLAAAIFLIGAALLFCYGVGWSTYDAVVHAVNEERRPLEVKRQMLQRRDLMRMRWSKSI